MIEEEMMEPIVQQFVAGNMGLIVALGASLFTALGSEIMALLNIKSNAWGQLIINITKGIIKEVMKGKTMKMLFVALTVAMLFCIPVSAAEFNPNIAADVVYTIEGESMQGIGTDLATWKDGMFQLRVAYVTALQDDSVADYTGIGIGVNIVKVIEKAGGNWIAVKLNPSLGIMGLADLNGDESPTVAVYMNIIKVDF